MLLQIEKLSKSFNSLKVFEDFNIDFCENKITCILGPSGCGKTTLLNIISGIMKYDYAIFSGFNRKKISYIFQEPRLLEWKTVWENIEFVLKEVYPKTKKRDKIITEYLKLVNLLEFKNYYPNKLSGGMKQRVSIARAFAYPSDILLMDEPFKGLDIRIKKILMDSFVKLWNKDLRTVVFVTHEVSEAVLLGDKIYVLSNMPTKILKNTDINIPQNRRNLNDPKINLLKDEIKSEFNY